MLLKLSSHGIYTIEGGESGIGNITRIENLYNRLPKTLSEKEENLDNVRKQLDNAKLNILRDFEHEERLSKLLVKQSRINTELEFKELSRQHNEIMEEPGEDNSTESAINISYTDTAKSA